MTPVHFVESTNLTLTSQPSTVVVVNESERSWDVELALSLYDGKGFASTPFTVTPPLQTVGSGESKPFTLTAAASDRIVKASGVLLLRARSGELSLSASRPVSSSPDAGGEPEVKKLALVSVKRLPFGRGSRPIRVTLPLKPGGACPVAKSGSRQAVTVSDGSRTAPLDYRCSAIGEAPAISFSASHLPGPGTYTGTLKVGTTDVEISVRRTTQVLWAIATLLLGFLLALFRHTWSTNRLPVRRADRRLATMSGDATRAQLDFHERSAGAPYHRYQFLEGAQRRIAVLRRDLDDARPSWLRHWWLAFIPSEKDHQDVVLSEATKKMAALDAIIKAWPALATDLAALQSQMDAIWANEPSADNLSDMAPRLVAHADATLNPAGGPERSLEADEAASLVAEVPVLTGALALLPVAAELGRRLDALDPSKLRGTDVHVFYRARQLYRQARVELLEAETAADVERAGVDELLQESRRLALQLVPDTSAWRTQTVTVTDPQAAFGPLVSAVHVVRRIATQLAGSAIGGRAVDVFWVFLALGLAIWTGLSALYVDKAWGTPRDFLAMFVWAIGVCTVVPLLLTTLGDLTAGPLPLKKQSAPADRAA